MQIFNFKSIKVDSSGEMIMYIIYNNIQRRRANFDDNYRNLGENFDD